MLSQKLKIDLDSQVVEWVQNTMRTVMLTINGFNGFHCALPADYLISNRCSKWVSLKGVGILYSYMYASRRKGVVTISFLSSSSIICVFQTFHCTQFQVQITSSRSLQSEMCANLIDSCLWTCRRRFLVLEQKLVSSSL